MFSDTVPGAAENTLRPENFPLMVCVVFSSLLPVVQVLRIQLSTGLRLERTTPLGCGL